MTTYGSVCSGIEAATVAWRPFGWKPAWFAQFDPEHDYSKGPDFPSTVLAHHYPTVPNLGDMTKIAAQVSNGNVPAPDVLVGGTPCQAFSVAGARRGLDDDRGFLTIKFVELANAIDQQRAINGNPPAVIVWENVPGVLSSKDNAFGAFLGFLSGEDCELLPPGGKWSNSGYVHGPQRTIAWRVLDAQYFGVAQRRRRVFVVASAREGFDPAAVLFEREGVRRDTQPRHLQQSSEHSESLVPRAYDMLGFGQYGNGITASTCKARDYKDATDLVVMPAGSVRRLMPVECERLQGFPEGYTLITYRGKPAADSHRYRALGNSMAVPCMAWIGKRVDAALRSLIAANDNKQLDDKHWPTIDGEFPDWKETLTARPQDKEESHG